MDYILIFIVMQTSENVPLFSSNCSLDAENEGKLQRQVVHLSNPTLI